MSQMNCRPNRPRHIPQTPLCLPQQCHPAALLNCCMPACPQRCGTPALPTCCPPDCSSSCAQICPQQCDCCPPPCPPTCTQRRDCCPTSLRQNAPLIGCCGRESQRCIPETLCVTGLPTGICTPITLTAIEASRDQPSVNLRKDCRGPSPIIAEVSVPLIAWVCDANGRTHCGYTQVVICVRMPAPCAACDGAFLANACVRLIESCRSCEPVFNVRLEVSAEVYMIRVNPCANSCANPSNPCCFPQKPLFPQPFYPTW